MLLRDVVEQGMQALGGECGGAAHHMGVCTGRVQLMARRVCQIWNTALTQAVGTCYGVPMSVISARSPRAPVTTAVAL